MVSGLSVTQTFSSKLTAWQQRGKYVACGYQASQVFVIDEGDSDADADDTLLLIHGFPESS